jgi:hypothetical protein
MAFTEQLKPNNLVLLFSTFLVILVLARWHRGSRYTKLNGPPFRGNLFLGYSKESLQIINHSHLFEKWATQYGAAFHIPAFMGVKNLVLCDPKAVAHYFANDTFTYRMPHAARFFFEIFVSDPFPVACRGEYLFDTVEQFRRNVLWAEAESHKRSGCMSNAAWLSTHSHITGNEKRCRRPLALVPYANLPPFSMTMPIWYPFLLMVNFAILALSISCS